MSFWKRAAPRCICGAKKRKGATFCGDVCVQQAQQGERMIRDEYIEQRVRFYEEARRQMIEQAVDEAWDGVKYSPPPRFIVPAGRPLS